MKVGFVSYTDATNGLPLPHPWSVNAYPAANPKAGAKAIIHDARKARDAGADAVIVQIHWGDEYASRPNNSQMAVAKKLTDSKVVSVVVGQGPHVVQPIERINRKFVVFSEGNLVSNQGAGAGLPAQTQDGLIALLHFRALGDRVAVRRVTYVPPGSGAATTWCCRPTGSRTTAPSASSEGATGSSPSASPRIACGRWPSDAMRPSSRARPTRRCWDSCRSPTVRTSTTPSAASSRRC